MRYTAGHLYWTGEYTPQELHLPLSLLAEDYTIKTGKGSGIRLHFKKSISGTGSVSADKKDACIEYVTVAQALRFTGMVLAGVLPQKLYSEKVPFTTLGIMLDCSRNAVITTAQFKKWLRRLALLGYNMAMLYTEDTYELEGNPLFGYMRGAYTKEELKDIDQFAAGLGIEIIPCIQTLGHLSQILKWRDYHNVKDTDSVLLAGSEDTYRLIDTMIGHCSGAFSSRRIHIGMDEAWDLGRGRYMSMNGCRDEFDIFNEHLARVVDICKSHALQPMIWSDMYFRIADPFKDYYNPDTVIPDRIKEKIPLDVQLVYWDYYHEDREFYKSHFTKHRELGHEPVMASGVWTWAKLWHQHHLTERKAGPCIEACRDAGVKELVFTMWGDDGGYCDFESAFTGLVWCAEKAFCTGSIDEKRVAGLFDSIYGGDYKAYKRAAEMNYSADAASILWDDPLMQLVLNHVIYTQKLDPLKAAASLKKLAKSLLKHEGDPELRHARIIAETTSMKLELIGRIRKAYERKDRKVMAVLGKEAIRVADQVDKLAESFRFMWLRHNKPFGLEGMQIRFAGQSERLRELKRRIDSFVKGKEAVIPEFEILIKNPQGGHNGGSYKQVSTASDWI